MSKQRNPREPQHLLVAFTVKNLHGQSELVFDGIADVSQQELDSIQCKSYTKSQMANKQGVLQNCMQLPLPPLKQFTPHSSLEQKSIQRSKKNGLGRKKQSSRRLRRGFPQAGWKLLSKKSLAKKLWTSYLKVAETRRMENYLRLRDEEMDMEFKHKKHHPHMRSKRP